MRHCLHVPWKYIAPHCLYIDLFLADLKKHVADGLRLRKAVDHVLGAYSRVLENLRKLAAAGKNGDSRPADSGFNADEETIKSHYRLCRRRARRKFISLPTTLGVNKCRLLVQPIMPRINHWIAPALPVAQKYACQKV
ncbi:hypothetical protein KCP76_18390 [Salmonella enterica subsp. enterica serovar Weltevreden]|nr:hypothetical protein KCP76_18390 [Salmonella enterica subsp. enterica serovar Weltevreden]